MSIFSFSKNSFEGQLPDENVVLLLRRHWFVLVGWTLLCAFLVLFPFIVYSIFGATINSIGAGSLYIFAIAVYLLVVWNAYFYGVMKYFLDTWIITDHRIIDSFQLGFFHRTVAEMHISRVQDVATNTAGLIPTFLNFGNVEIQSAGAQQKFLFMQVPYPNEVKDVIMQANNKFIRSHPSGAEPGHAGL